MKTMKPETIYVYAEHCQGTAGTEVSESRLEELQHESDDWNAVEITWDSIAAFDRLKSVYGRRVSRLIRGKIPVAASCRLGNEGCNPVVGSVVTTMEHLEEDCWNWASGQIGWPYDYLSVNVTDPDEYETSHDPAIIASVQWEQDEDGDWIETFREE